MDGFLPGSRASFILDFIVVAMAVVLPLLGVSVYFARIKKNYRTHKNMQIYLGIILGIAIIAFEIDMRFIGWRHLARVSPYYDTLVFPSLYIHLAFAVPTLFLWIYTIGSASRNAIMTKSNLHRAKHKYYGRLSVYAMIATTFTGWIFYWLAFVAS